MNILITHALSATQDELQQLAQLGLTITVHPDERVPVVHPEQYEAVICNGLFQFHDIRLFSNLRFIQLTSAGMDRLPMDAIRARGIRVFNAAGVYAVPMAEWTILALLEIYRSARFFLENQAARNWEKNRSLEELCGKTACIVGFGAYGQEVARRLGAFGVRRIVVNRTLYHGPLAEASFPLSCLDEVLPQVDLVILALALTPQTQHVLGRRQLALMRPDAVIVNAARGALVDEAALIEALAENRLRGAALDVFEAEPLPLGSPLWADPRVYVFPHNAFAGNGTHRRMMEVVARNLRHWKEM